MTDDLVLWTIYDHPTDYPGNVVARAWCIDRDGVAHAEGLLVAPSLEAARALLPEGLTWTGRDLLDDSKIVETWI